MISYAILVSNEADEFNKLITYLVRVKDPNDEIVVLVDSSNTNSRIRGILANNSSNIKYAENPLDGNFSNQKNILFSMCSKEYIFNLDADEMVSEEFIENLKIIIQNNPEIDAFWVPRWNEVSGITNEWILKWGWHMDNLNRINWPDLQMRILKNYIGIKWSGTVHEQLSGYKSYGILPLERECAIFHKKSLEKQIAQNEFYNNISRISKQHD
jgi:glycosyltransferase involved in cell wall biosynthesis